ncbi:hypothetical protein CASFOL_027208 [Castilleja foliolosa]|uniref:GTD-binding domain-containing protein n=1 Tax=Castilleja foliolosa TaxID=1961234 RepID=A0ABD3CF82_9LAMI
MESENPPSMMSLVKCSNCSSLVMKRSFSETYLKSVKRKNKEIEEENKFTIPEFVFTENARVEIGNECVALRETVSNQQQTIQDLISELEQERSAASSAANEAMSMILRLQRDKAAIQMELRQFKWFTEEKMAHDQQEAFALQDLLYKREQAILSLTCAVQAYRHRMMSYGLTEAEADTDILEGQFDFPPYEYPPVKCNSYESDGDYGILDTEKYSSWETPCSRDQLKDLEHRINQLERSPRAIQPDSAKSVLEKVIVGYSPRTTPRHLSKLPSNSPLKEIGPDFFRESPKSAKSFRKAEFSYIQENSNLRKVVDNASEVGDDLSDRIYTIDSVFQGASFNRIMDCKAYGDEYMASPRESMNPPDVRDIEIQKLYARLHALEADRESMRQEIVSIGTNKAQVLLLKEIAQNLCKQMPLGRSVPARKQSVIGSFFFMSVFKTSMDSSSFFLEKKSAQMQVHVRLITQQRRVANAFRT